MAPRAELNPIDWGLEPQEGNEPGSATIAPKVLARLPWVAVRAAAPAAVIAPPATPQSFATATWVASPELPVATVPPNVWLPADLSPLTTPVPAIDRPILRRDPPVAPGVAPKEVVEPMSPPVAPPCEVPAEVHFDSLVATTAAASSPASRKRQPVGTWSELLAAMHDELRPYSGLLLAVTLLALAGLLALAFSPQEATRQWELPNSPTAAVTGTAPAKAFTDIAAVDPVPSSDARIENPWLAATNTVESTAAPLAARGPSSIHRGAPGAMGDDNSTPWQPPTAIAGEAAVASLPIVVYPGTAQSPASLAELSGGVAEFPQQAQHDQHQSRVH